MVLNINGFYCKRFGVIKSFLKYFDFLCLSVRKIVEDEVGMEKFEQRFLMMELFV